MPATCIVPRCGHQQGVCNLRRFPINTVRLQKWLENMNRRNNWTPESTHRICECHFAEDQFENKGRDGLKILRPDAVPTVFIKKLHSRKTKPQPRLLESEEQDDSENVVKMEVVDDSGTSAYEDVHIPTNSQVENEHEPEVHCENVESYIKKEINESADVEPDIPDSTSNTPCTNTNCEKIRNENRQLRKKLAKLRKGLDRLIKTYDATGDADNVQYYIISDVVVKEES